MKCFGIEASVKIRSLKTAKDWGAARDAARGAAWDAAGGAAWDAARDAAWDAARGAARDAARDAARGATETVAQDFEGFKSKYPKGAFVPLFELWEMGLYPIGVTSGKFVIYRPE